MTFALVTCLRVLQDIWSPTSGAYSVNKVLTVMVRGLDAQLAALLEPEEPRETTLRVA